MTYVIVVSAAAASGGDLSGLTTSLLALLSKIGSLLLIVFIGYKALGHIAQDQFGKAVGLIVIALIPALFLFDPSGASRLLQATVKTLTGGCRASHRAGRSAHIAARFISSYCCTPSGRCGRGGRFPRAVCSTPQCAW